MGQFITTLLSIMLLLVVPVGVAQVHTVLQMKSELQELSFAAAKFVNNHGGQNESEIETALRQFVQQELGSKTYRLKPEDVMVSVQRIVTTNPDVWSHEDEFSLQMEMPYPLLSGLFPEWARPLEIQRIGTIQVMDYDL